MLANNGHQVTISGGWFSHDLAALDRRLVVDAPYRFTTFADIRPGGIRSLPRLRKQILRRIAQSRFARNRCSSPDLFGLFARESLKFARQNSADLTIVHSEAGLYVASHLDRTRRRVGADFEDWFSEDLLPHDRLHRPIADLKAFEARVLRDSDYVVTTSHALANELGHESGTAKPTVVYNTFPSVVTDAMTIDRARDSRAVEPRTLHWFSQTIGPGRGLELLFSALPLVREACGIHLRGQLSPANRSWLELIIPGLWRERVHLHPTVPNAELNSRIAEHDIGLALEESACPSRDLTVTNKFFQYLQAGLAIIATDTRGQREVAALANAAVALIPQRSPAALAEAISGLLCNRERLEAAKAAARVAHRTVFSWDRSAAALINRLEMALEGRRPR